MLGLHLPQRKKWLLECLLVVYVNPLRYISLREHLHSHVPEFLPIECFECGNQRKCCLCWLDLPRHIYQLYFRLSSSAGSAASTANIQSVSLLLIVTRVYSLVCSCITSGIFAWINCEVCTMLTKAQQYSWNRCPTLSQLDAFSLLSFSLSASCTSSLRSYPKDALYCVS